MGNQSRNRRAREDALTPDAIDLLLFAAEDKEHERVVTEVIATVMPFAPSEWGQYRTFKLGWLGQRIRLDPDTRKRLLRIISDCLKDNLGKDEIVKRILPIVQEVAL